LTKNGSLKIVFPSKEDEDDEEESKNDSTTKQKGGEFSAHMVPRWYRPPEIILGNSYYDNTDKEMVTYLGGTYYYFRDRFMTSFVNEKARNLYDFTVQSTAPIDSMNYYLRNVERNEKRLRAMIQRYNRDLILNQTTVNEKKNTLHNKSNLRNR
jgi:hypothetical protein